nr:hypothetical protein CFP56_78425 [Quercus suber]
MFRSGPAFFPYLPITEICPNLVQLGRDFTTHTLYRFEKRSGAAQVRMQTGLRYQNAARRKTGSGLEQLRRVVQTKDAVATRSVRRFSLSVQQAPKGQLFRNICVLLLTVRPEMCSALARRLPDLASNITALYKLEGYAVRTSRTRSVSRDDARRTANLDR